MPYTLPTSICSHQINRTTWEAQNALYPPYSYLTESLSPKFSMFYIIVLTSLVWDLKQYVNNGPSSEGEPGGVDNQEVMHEVNPTLRRSH